MMREPAFGVANSVSSPLQDQSCESKHQRPGSCADNRVLAQLSTGAHLQNTGKSAIFGHREIQAVDATGALLEGGGDHFAAGMDAQLRASAAGGGVEPFAGQQWMRLVGQDQFDGIELGALRLVHGHRPGAFMRRQFRLNLK